MQKKYETPEFEIVVFDLKQDVITTSTYPGGLTGEDTGSGDSGNFEDMFEGEW